MTQPTGRSESLFGLAKQLIGGSVRLARLEVQHGRQEIGERLGENKRGAFLFAIAAALAFLALIALVGLLIGLVAIFLPLWASALIWLVLFVVMAIVFAMLGRRRIRSPVPEQTIASVKEDIEWAKRLLRRD